MLTASEQTLLRRLCVFGGRFTLDDVESACTGDEVPTVPTLDVLSSLVDKSLVLKEDVKDVACYRLHETMREYAGVKLREAGERESVELRCTEYYRDRCQRSIAEARYGLVEWLAWMDLEIDNVRTILSRCVARQDRQRGLELASFVGWYWVTRATSEGVRWFYELLGPGDGYRQAPALAHFIRGFLAILQSDPTAARPPLDRAAALADQEGQDSLRVQSRCLASIAAHMAGDRPAASRLLETAHAIMTSPDDFPATIALLQAHVLGGMFEGDLDTVRSASSEGVRRSRAAGDLYALEMVLLNQGLGELIGGHLDESQPPLIEALRVARQIDDRVAQSLLLHALGCQAAGSGAPRLAAQLLGAAETAQSSVGPTVFPYLAAPVTQATASTRTALGTHAFQTEFEAGKRLSRGTALGIALGEPAHLTGAALGGTVAHPLGKREAQIAHLIADGLTNKQIGASLLISEHTVDSHIRNIMNKLGVSRRAQIAAWMASSHR